MHLLLFLALAAFTVAGCNKPDKRAVAAAVVDVQAAAVDLESAWQLVRHDPALAQAHVNVVDAYLHLRAAADTLGLPLLPPGSVLESCANRCHNECGGLDVAACLLHCSDCHPACCGDPACCNDPPERGDGYIPPGPNRAAECALACTAGTCAEDPAAREHCTDTCEQTGFPPDCGPDPSG